MIATRYCLAIADAQYFANRRSFDRRYRPRLNPIGRFGQPDQHLAGLAIAIRIVRNRHNVRRFLLLLAIFAEANSRRGATQHRDAAEQVLAVVGNESGVWLDDEVVD